jgi:hypothetical protein
VERQGTARHGTAVLFMIQEMKAECLSRNTPCNKHSVRQYALSHACKNLSSVGGSGLKGLHQ